MTDLGDEPTQPSGRRRMARGSFVPRPRRDRWWDGMDLLVLGLLLGILGAVIVSFAVLPHCE